MQSFVKERAIVHVKPSEVRAFASSIPGTAKHVRKMMTPLRQTFADTLDDDLTTVVPIHVRVACETNERR